MEVLWWRPRRVEEHFARQGIRGPPYRFFIGCVREMVALMVAASAKPMPPPYRSHNGLPRVLAFYHHWKKIYGKHIQPTIPFHGLASYYLGVVSSSSSSAHSASSFACLLDLPTTNSFSSFFFLLFLI